MPPVALDSLAITLITSDLDSHSASALWLASTRHYFTSNHIGLRSKVSSSYRNHTSFFFLCQSTIIFQFMKGGEKLTLREMRESVHLQQEDVARRLNVDQSAVSKWENGKARPCRKYHAKLAKLYGVSVDDLLSDNEEVK